LITSREQAALGDRGVQRRRTQLPNGEQQRAARLSLAMLPDGGATWHLGC